MGDDLPAIVIDNGSGLMKAGLAGNNNPTAVFPTIVGAPEKAGLCSGMGQKDDYVGLEAVLKKGVLSLNYPMDHAVVTSWPQMERIWHHTFYHALRLPPEEHPLLLTDAPLNPRANREEMAEVMFETFYVPKLYVIIQSVLALYCSGQTSGLVIDSGDGLTFAVPFFEGAAILPAIRRLEIGGRDLTSYLVKLLAEKGYSFSNSAGFEIVRDIKEKLGALALDFSEVLRSPKQELEESYTLPDGHVIKIDQERYRCAEALFDPDQLGVEADGIHRMALSSIQRCGVDVRKYLYNNILLSGGTTTFSGFEKRFTHSLQSILPSTTSITVNSPNNRNYSVWIGGSVLASLNTFQQMWIDRKLYDEEGRGVVSKKCF